MKLLWLVPFFTSLPLAAGTIEGLVTNSVTGAGISGVKVTAQVIPPGNSLPGMTTDGTGSFRIANAPDGEYRFAYSKDGYYPSRVNAPSIGVRVSGDAHVDLPMTPRTSLQGRVFDPEGNPAAGIAVTLDAYGNTATTDENGLFKLENLKPGSSRLSAKPRPQAQPKNGERTVTTYYPSILNSTQAPRIQVQGIDLFGYDIRLQTAPARRVRGVILEANGTPAAHAAVTLLRPATPRAVVIDGRLQSIEPASQTGGRVESAENGTFEFPAVLEGDWMLRANLGSNMPRSGAAEIRVAREDIDNVEIKLAGPFFVTVSTDWGDSTPLHKPRLFTTFANLFDLDGQAAGGMEIGTQARLIAFAGRYLVEPTTPTEPGYYLDALMLDNRDVRGQIVDLSGPAELKIVYKKGGGSVRGTVEGCGGGTIVLMADAFAATRLGWSAVCDANGGFSLSDIPPGDYTAALFRDPLDMARPDFESLLAARGERVKVEDGAVATPDLHAR